MRHSLQLTNSVILQRHFKMTAQIKILQKTRNVIRGWQPSGLKMHKKEDTQQRHVKHDFTRRFDRKSFQMDDANRLADYSSELKNLPNWKSTDHIDKSRGNPGRMAELSKAPDSRYSSVENSGTLVFAWFRIPLLSENVLITMMHSLQLTNSVILERQFKMTVQSKRKQKTRNVIGRLIAGQFKNAQKKRIPGGDM